MSATVKEFVRVQKERLAIDLRVMRLEKNNAPREYVEFWRDITQRLAEREEELAKDIKAYAKDHPLWWNFASHVKGIGELLFGKIVMALDESVGIHNFRYPSALWRWCGLAVVELPDKSKIAQTRVTGELAKEWKFDRDIRRFLYQLAECFVRNGGVYREHYERFRENSEKAHPDWNPGHHHNHAMRLVAKLFLAHLWEEARKLYGLPVHQPYAMEKLGHKTYYAPVWEKTKRSRKERRVYAGREDQRAASV